MLKYSSVLIHCIQCNEDKPPTDTFVKFPVRSFLLKKYEFYRLTYPLSLHVALFC